MSDLLDALTADDRAQLKTIQQASTDHDTALAIHAYYHDLDRANRTPRELLYLHLGILTGTILRLLDKDE